MKTIRSLVETYYDVQNMRIEVDNQIRAYSTQASEQEIKFIVDSVSEPLTTIEEDIKKHINKSLKKDPVYEYLSGIKGIGPILAGGLMAWIVDIEKFPTISKLWSYSGVAGGYVKSECAKGHKIISTSLPLSCPIFATKTVGLLEGMELGDTANTKKKNLDKAKCGAKMTLLEKHDGEVARRQVGWFILQNTRLKTHVWKIGESFVKTKGGYRELYDQFRAEYNEKWQTPADCKSRGCAKYKKCLDAHKYMAAKRKTVKVFLAHLHMKWSELKGLPIDHPFIIGREGHSHLIPIIYE